MAPGALTIGAGSVAAIRKAGKYRPNSYYLFLNEILFLLGLSIAFELL